MFASGASNPRSGRDIDAEHGSGTADPKDSEFGRVLPMARHAGYQNHENEFFRKTGIRVRAYPL